MSNYDPYTGSAVWAPRGRRLAFVGPQAREPHVAFLTVRPDGSAPRTLFHFPPNAFIYNIAWQTR